MIKIFNTQLNGIFQKIDAQESEIDIAARLLAQAIIGQGKVYIKGFGDLRYLEEFLTSGDEKLPDTERLITETVIDQTDRVILMAPYYDESVIEYIADLEKNNIDYVLVCNKDPRIDCMNFIDLSTPRALVPTEDFSRIITPHVMAMNYIYYILYALIKEMLDEEL
ncbi:DUF2529 family protein [Macrococcus hajekii]|uniref:DUF2529 family protein n=1 Tax=Macrococcus hajekii TaxID=198482 RepID=A0A4R6BHV4_9STAP|nr:DUF2529 family protein [Macrococcus hajekii]TDM01125.1 DUF2529 family protein [Macrococcus hajekii]GGB12251.1 hypothetical protein GCM10007190_20400 [Macrococcus hajekii]